jgi:hypothetical protein
MHSGYYSHCGFNTITISCPLLGWNKFEGSLEKNKKTQKYGVVSQKSTNKTLLVH